MNTSATRVPTRPTPLTARAQRVEQHHPSRRRSSGTADTLTLRTLFTATRQTATATTATATTATTSNGGAPLLADTDTDSSMQGCTVSHEVLLRRNYWSKHRKNRTMMMISSTNPPSLQPMRIKNTNQIRTTTETHAPFLRNYTMVTPNWTKSHLITLECCATLRQHRKILRAHTYL